MAGPGGEHESAVAAFAAYPDVTAELLDRTFRIGLPNHDGAYRGPTVFQKLVPASYHADNTLVFTRAGRPVFAIVIEVQRRWLRAKWRSWKYYATSLEHELGVGVIVAVFCPKAQVADCYRRLTGKDRFSVRLWPCVLSADDVPLVVNAEQARLNLPLAALSVVCHGADSGLEAGFAALYDAMRTVDLEQARRICDMVLVGLSKPARAKWEEHMAVVDSEYRSELFRELEARSKAEGKAEGEAKGKREDVLTLLEVRGVHVPEVIRRQIAACADLDLLDAWFRRAITATSIEDVLS